MRRNGKTPAQRTSTRDYSRNIAVHMTEEQYQRLERYRKMTRHGVTTYFQKLIDGDRMLAHSKELSHSMHRGVNMIHSNVRQIARCRRANEIAPESVRTLVFLADKLCEEVFLLSCQE